MAVALFSDAHRGNGRRGDICNYAGLDLVLDLIDDTPDINEVIEVGDGKDFTRFGVGACLEASLPFLYRVRTRIVERKRRFTWVLGNHDGSAFKHWKQVNEVLLTCGLVHNSDYFRVCGGWYPFVSDNVLWYAIHGHQFDPANKDGWFKPVAEGLTFVSGQIGRIAPGWDDQYINPVHWISAAKRGEEAQKVIQHGAVKWADKHNANVAFGHTHNLGDVESEFSGFRAVNLGCVCKGRASAVIIRGHKATLYPLMGYEQKEAA
jgi:metallophosphoesterase superfamily enzyme